MPSPLRLIKPEIPTSTMLPDSPSLAPLPKPLLDSCPLEQLLQNRIMRFRLLMTANPSAAVAALNIVDWALRIYDV